MAELTTLRQKIKSIKTTKKITHAVRLVSMSSYSRLEKQKNSIQNYNNKLLELFNYVKIHSKEWENERLLSHDILDRRPLLVIVSTSRGLCGSLNTNLLRYLQKSLILENHQRADLITIGTKAQKFIKELKLTRETKIMFSFNELNSSNYQHTSKQILEVIFGQKKAYSSVVFFSNKIKNFFAQLPEKTTIIPISKGTNEQSKAGDLIWTENSSLIIDSIAKSYIESTISNLLFNAIISEQAARFLAMDGATNNAEKYLEQLTLQYNKTRQALITKEVAELSSGLQN